jgi:hypothetical protein
VVEAGDLVGGEVLAGCESFVVMFEKVGIEIHVDIGIGYIISLLTLSTSLK